MSLKTQFTREGNLLITGDAEVLVKAQKDSNEVIASLGNTEKDKETKALIEANRSHYANLTPNVDNLTKLFEVAQSSSDSFYAEKYVEMKARIFEALELQKQE